MKPKSKTGFTLIELSIVLVIIGLIVGGVLVGRDLIKTAELRSVITDVEKFNTAINTFRIKFNCLPGDCLEATTALGVPLDAFDCATNNPLAAGYTCNGNGDGIITGRNDNPIIAGSGWHSEGVLAWQHLSLAGLIPGNYSGYVPLGSTSSNGGPAATAPFSSPSSRIANACYDIDYGWPDDTGNIGVLWPAAIPGHFIHFGSPGWATCSFGAITPPQAYSLDLKIDDGIPYSGRVLNNNPGSASTGCVVDPSGNWITGSGRPIAYNVSLNTPVCALGFQAQGF